MKKMVFLPATYFWLTSVIRNRIHAFKKTISTFVDFWKAFDVVDRQLLFHQLETKGLYGKLLGILKQLYVGTVNLITLNCLKSNEFESKQGMMQGNNFFPMVFCGYIDDLIKKIKQTNVGVTVNSANCSKNYPS